MLRKFNQRQILPYAVGGYGAFHAGHGLLPSGCGQVCTGLASVCKQSLDVAPLTASLSLPIGHSYIPRFPHTTSL